jgi:hypothetical protein
MHGKSKIFESLPKLKKVAAGIELISILNSDDYNIEIPYIVRSKISKKRKCKG